MYYYGNLSTEFFFPSFRFIFVTCKLANQLNSCKSQVVIIKKIAKYKIYVILVIGTSHKACI